MGNYTIIHAHSCYSFQDGVMDIESYVKRVKECGMKGASLTEHGNMASSLKFYHECRKQGINPVIGVEAYINDIREEGLAAEDYQEEEEATEDRKDMKNSHILLLAKNYTGFKDIIHISGEAMVNGYRWRPRTTNTFILQRAGHFIVTTACQASQFARWIMAGEPDKVESLLWKYKEAFKDDFYIEVQLQEGDIQKEVNAGLLKLSKKLEIPVVLGMDIHYLDAEDWELQELKMLMAQGFTKKALENPETLKRKPFTLESKELFFKSYDEVFEASKRLGYEYTNAQLQEWMEQTNNVNSKVNIEIPLYDIKYPKYVTPNNESITDYFTKCCVDGFKERFKDGRIPKDKLKEYTDKLKEEVNIICQMGFASYFLIIRDALDKVRIMGGRVGAGRGSVVGSLAAFCLRITNLDPIRFNLYFERFINPHRKDPVDIDCDISSDEQKKLEAELKGEYGRESVAHVVNYVHYGPKNAFRDIARYLSWPNEIANNTSKQMDEEESLKDNWKNLKRNLKQPEYQRLLIQDEAFIVKWGSKLENQVRHVAQHASGTVIAPGKLYDFIPVYRYKDEILTAYQEGTDIREVSEIGLVKLDLLGLNICSIINDTIQLVKKYQGKNIEKQLDNDPLTDQAIYDRFAVADTLDIFQFGSEGMRTMLRETNPETLDDLAAINGLYRPATIKAGFVNQYIQNKNDPLAIQYLHPKLRDILGRTYGVIVFQEQVMDIFRALGGFTLAEADGLRKLMKLVYKSEDIRRKKEWEEVMQRFRKSAIAQGMSEDSADALLKQMLEYANYAFNAAHAYGYAKGAYEQMWLKVHYPLEYACALLNRSSQDDLSVSLTEARKCGKVNFMEINNSEWDFTISKGQINCGMRAAKGVVETEIAKLQQHKPFLTIESLLKVVFEDGVSKRTMEPLIKLGALDSIVQNRKALFTFYEQLRDKKKKDPDPVLDLAQRDFAQKEKVGFERDYLGFYWNEHPFNEGIKMALADKGCSSPKEAKVKSCNEIAGFVTKKVIKKTKKGKEYVIYEIEDDTDTLTIKCWDAHDQHEVGDLLAFTDVNHDSYGYSVRGSECVFVLAT